MYLKYFKIFGLDKYQMRFSTHDPSRLTGDNAKFVNEPELWIKEEHREPLLEPSALKDQIEDLIAANVKSECLKSSGH